MVKLTPEQLKEIHDNYQPNASRREPDQPVKDVHRLLEHIAAQDEDKTIPFTDHNTGNGWMNFGATAERALELEAAFFTLVATTSNPLEGITVINNSDELSHAEKVAMYYYAGYAMGNSQGDGDESK